MGKTVLSRGRHRVWAKDYSLVFCKWNRAWDCIEGGAKLTNIVEIFINEYCPGNLSINIVDCSQHYLWCSTIPEKDYESVTILGKATMDHHIYCRINIGDHIWSAIWKDDFRKDWISKRRGGDSYHLRICINNESIRERFLVWSWHTSNIIIPENSRWAWGIINETQCSTHKSDDVIFRGTKLNPPDTLRKTFRPNRCRRAGIVRINSEKLLSRSRMVVKDVGGTRIWFE